MIFEDDIVKNAEKTLVKLYKFLGLSPDFKPENPNKTVMKVGRGHAFYLHITLKIFSEKISKIVNQKLQLVIDRYDCFGSNGIKNDDSLESIIFVPGKES